MTKENTKVEPTACAPNSANRLSDGFDDGSERSELDRGPVPDITTTVRHLLFPRSKLDDWEKELIQNADRRGLPLVNKVLVSNIAGETDFDYLLGPKQQERWLAASGANKPGRALQVGEKFRGRYRREFQRLVARPEYPALKSILRGFIRNCVPYPRTTEMSFWELTCMPSTNSAHHPRFFSLNINFMEVLVAGWEARSGGFWGFVNTSRDLFLDDEIVYPKDLARRYPNLRRRGLRTYRAAGFDQAAFDFDEIGEFASFLEHPRLVRASKEFNLRLMRKGATVYARYHCFDVVDDLLKSSNHR